MLTRSIGSYLPGLFECRRSELGKLGLERRKSRPQALHDNRIIAHNKPKRLASIWSLGGCHARPRHRYTGCRKSAFVLERHLVRIAAVSAQTIN